ncbi:MAG: glycosyltransferase, partial [Clostridia bacterium]|nr:glycosyltransferase [Clostridia bacterium]
METPTVSLAVVAYNAEACLGALLDDIRAQTHPFDQMELLLIDSASTDGTRALMEGFRQEAAGWQPPLCVRVLHNPGRILACGCNVALDAYAGGALLRLDAHARIPPNFVQANARALTEERDIVGGQVASMPPRTAREAPLVALDASRFAGGAAAFRNAGEA